MIGGLSEVYAVNVVLNGVQKFQQDVMAMQSAVARTNTFVAQAAGGIGLAMLGMAGAAAKASVQFALHQQKMNEMIQRTWGESALALLDYTEALEAASGTNQDVMLQALRFMGTMGVTAQQAERAIKAAVDTAAALELPDEAVEQIGKVMALLSSGSPTASRQLRMLERTLGIPVTDILTKATGLSAEEAFKLPGEQIAEALLKGLEQRFAGGLGAFGTFDRLMKRIRISISEFWETTGFQLIRGFETTGDVVAGVLHQLRLLNERLGGKLGLAVLLGLVVGGVKLLKYWFDATFGAVNRLTLALRELAATMGGTTVAAGGAKAAGAAAVVPVLGKNLKALGGGIIAAIAMMIIGPLLDYLTQGKGKLAEQIGDVIENTVGLGAVGGMVGGLHGAAIGGVIGVVKGIVEAITGRSSFGFGPQIQYGQKESERAAKQTAENTKKMAEIMEEQRAGLIGGRDRAKRVLSDMEIQIAMARALGTGIG